MPSLTYQEHWRSTGSTETVLSFATPRTRRATTSTDSSGERSPPFPNKETQR